MNPLANLRSLLKKLTKDEIRTLTLFLEFQSTRGGSPSKSLQLVQVLLDDVSYTSSDIQKVLYNDANPAAFYKLIGRVKEKVFEVILFDQHLNESSYTLRNKTVFSLKKKLLICELLLNRGIIPELENKLKDIIREARDYEIYDVLSQALVVLRRMYIVSKKKKQVELASNEIAFYKKAEFLVDNANSEFSRMMNRINYSFGASEFVDDLAKLVENLRIWLNETKSASLGYNYYLLKTELLQQRMDFEAADECLVEFGKFLTSRPVFSTNNRTGTWRLNYASNLLHLGDYKNAFNNASDSLSLFKGVSLNEVLSLEVMFLSKFYIGDIANCQDILNESSSRLNKLDSIVIERFKFYQSVIDIINRKYQEAESILYGLSDLKKDKEGWNVVRKILQLICRIELGDYDSVDLQAQNLHKYVKRVSTQKHIKPRFVLILRILNKLINEGYNFKATFNSRRSYFELLEGNDPLYKWNPKSPELIAFTDWFKSKLKRQDVFVA